MVSACNSSIWNAEQENQSCLGYIVSSRAAMTIQVYHVADRKRKLLYNKNVYMGAGDLVQQLRLHIVLTEDLKPTPGGLQPPVSAVQGRLETSSFYWHLH